MGILRGIAYKAEKYGELICREKAFVGLKTGVEQDHRGAPGKRQVTVLAEEDFSDACREIKVRLDWTKRRANLLLRGINLEQSTGKYLRIGDIILEITGETEPCLRMEEQYAGLQNALAKKWRGGVTCKVVREGNIEVGDEVELF